MTSSAAIYQDTALLVSLAVGGASLGYWLASGPLARKKSATSNTVTVPTPHHPDEQSHEDEDGEDGEELSSVKPGILEECKLVLVVRSDLGMSTGKIAAQCSHATLACYKALSKNNPQLLKHWERTGQTKVALRCDSEDDLLLLQAQAKSLNICARSIQDAGRTQIVAGSRTVLGIGPGPVRLVNQVTGKLRLL